MNTRSVGLGEALKPIVPVLALIGLAVAAYALFGGGTDDGPRGPEWAGKVADGMDENNEYWRDRFSKPLQ